MTVVLTVGIMESIWCAQEGLEQWYLCSEPRGGFVLPPGLLLSNVSLNRIAEEKCKKGKGLMQLNRAQRVGL